MTKTKIELWVKLFQDGKFNELERQAANFIKKHPKDGVAWKAYAVALSKQGKDELDAAIKACELLPNDYEPFFNLGKIYEDRNEHEKASEYYEKSLQIDNKHAKVWNNYGNMLSSQQRFHDAIKCFYTAITLDPAMSEAYCNLAGGLLGLGKYSKACDYYQKTLELNPDFVEAHSNMIFALDLMSSENTESQQNARKLWAAAYTDHIVPCSEHANSLDANRRLRIGYVSGDFRQHSAARVFGGMLVDYDRNNFEVYCYDNKAQPDDEYTEEFRKYCHWRKAFGMTDDELFHVIQHDQIDILVDLSGHSAQNRLEIFAMKPAPINVTAWGYATGTGMKQMDYFFADKIDVPENEQQFYTEQIAYLPCVATSYFVEDFPDVGPLPALKNGYITFGCLNRLHKVTDEAFKIWAEILLAVPNSRMVMKAGELSDPEICKQVMWNFMRAGITEDRITLIGNTNGKWHDHVSTYNMIDIALDPFPHGGGVSAMECLKMGVPIIALSWPTIVGRLSSSILHAVDMQAWVAKTANEYIKLAIEKSNDVEALKTLREQLRNRFDKSFLGDRVAYVQEVENQYMQMWSAFRESKYSLTSEAA